VIRINLLPGAARRSSRRLPRLGLPKRARSGGGKPFDRWMAFIVVAWIAGPMAAGWLYFETSTAKTDLNVAIEGARADSARYAEIRKANALMLARQDTIAQKLEIIQEIDAGRFSWVHVLDEISNALPRYTWLSFIVPVPGKSTLQAPVFSIEGRTGNTFALTEFMQQLEASPFLKSITLVTTDQVREGENLLYSFVLEGEYEQPPAELIRTIPIFDREGGQ
jgi:Tfp pilus assembly protein PilN